LIFGNLRRNVVNVANPNNLLKEKEFKMDEKTMMKKNLLGAFLGGFAGLLIFGYSKDFYLLGLGVFLGVLVGWCYQEIFCSIVSIYRKCNIATGKKILKYIYAKISKLKADIAIQTQAVNKDYHQLIMEWQKIFCNIISFCKKCVSVGGKSLDYVCAKAGMVKQFANQNPAWVVRALAVVVYFVIGCLFFTRVYNLNNTLNNIINIFVYCVFPLIFICMEIDSPFHKKLKKYQDFGALKFFFSDIISLFRVQIFLNFFLYFGFAYFSVTGVLFLLFAFLATVYILSIKTIYKTVKSSRYWLCIFATMAITGTSAYFLKPFMENMQLLWVIAFFNGIVCGLVAEALRRGIEWLFKHTKIGRYYIFIKEMEYLKNLLSPSFHWIFKGWEAMNFKKLLYGL
jgi:hypothetical protein